MTELNTIKIKNRDIDNKFAIYDYGGIEVIINIKTGYINGNKISNQDGKKFSCWMDNKNTKELIDSIDKELNRDIEIKTPVFLFIESSSIIRGTYLHPILFNNLLNSLSSKTCLRLFKLPYLLSEDKLDELASNTITTTKTTTVKKYNEGEWKKILLNVNSNFIFEYRNIKPYRIDAYLNINSIHYLLEYDENEHKKYDMFKELIRYKAIADYYTTPFIIIRFSDTFIYGYEHIADVIEYSKSITTSNNIIFVEYKNPLNVDKILEKYNIYFFNFSY